MKYVFKNPSVFIKKKELLDNALQSLHTKCWEVNYSVFAEHVFSAKWSSHFFAVLQIACDIMKSYWVLQHQISQHSECFWLDKGKKKTLNENENHTKRFGLVLFSFWQFTVNCRYSNSKLSDFIWFYLYLYFPDYIVSRKKGCRAKIGSCSLLIPGVFSLRGTVVCQQSNGSGTVVTFRMLIYSSTVV